MTDWTIDEIRFFESELLTERESFNAVLSIFKNSAFDFKSREVSIELIYAVSMAAAGRYNKLAGAIKLNPNDQALRERSLALADMVVEAYNCANELESINTDQ